MLNLGEGVSLPPVVIEIRGRKIALLFKNRPWFCKTCDSRHNHGQKCPKIVLLEDLHMSSQESESEGETKTSKASDIKDASDNDGLVEVGRKRKSRRPKKTKSSSSSSVQKAAPSELGEEELALLELKRKQRLEGLHDQEDNLEAIYGRPKDGFSSSSGSPRPPSQKRLTESEDLSKRLSKSKQREIVEENNTMYDNDTAKLDTRNAK